MTERSDNIEPPFARRHIQLTVAVFTVVAFSWLLLTSRSVSTSIQHTLPSRNGETTDSTPTALLQIDLNSAPSRELALLPRVGPVLAKRIVENRVRLGPFQSVEDLGRVYGIGPKTLAEIRGICVVDAPAAVERSSRQLASSSDLAGPDR